MATEDQIRQKARAVGKKYRTGVLIEADLLDVENDDSVTSVKVTDADIVNHVYAKVYGSDERLVEVSNIRVHPRAKSPVWIRRLPDDTYEVEGGRARDGSELYGEAAATVFTPELIGELMATVWSARNLKPGRARLSDLGGMYLHIEPFFHSSGYFGGGDISLTANLPVTTDYQAWVKVWYDPIGAVLGATTGTEYNLATPLSETELGNLTIPTSYIPLAGVLLTEGDTAISASTVIIAAQNWIDAPVGNEDFFPLTVTDARVIPSNRQLVISQVTIDTGGSIQIDGLLQVIG